MKIALASQEPPIITEELDYDSHDKQGDISSRPRGFID